MYLYTACSGPLRNEGNDPLTGQPDIDNTNYSNHFRLDPLEFTCPSKYMM
jgi:hypothetical protein